MPDWGLSLLALTTAVAIGWVIGSKQATRTKANPEVKFRSQYFRGLNYLLNEQQDKAIEVFLRLAEVNQDTVETHYALGSLFRRRGEVDRAIRCHQNIIAKPALTDRQRTRALLELGEDYMRAGLLDRAERLFSELVENDAHTPSALRHLLDIYQQEKDWHKAISIAQRLSRADKQSMGHIIGNYYCVLAEESIGQGDTEESRSLLRQARHNHPASVRACLLEAQMAEQLQQWGKATDAYLRAFEYDQDCLPEILPAILSSLKADSRDSQIPELLDRLLSQTDGITPVIARAKIYQENEGREAASEFLIKHLRRHPSVRGLASLIDMNSAGSISSDSDNREILLELTRQLLKNQPLYRCTQCGFSGQHHQWHCPSCKSWDTTRRIRGVTGE